MGATDERLGVDFKGGSAGELLELTVAVAAVASHIFRSAGPRPWRTLESFELSTPSDALLEAPDRLLRLPAAGPLDIGDFSSERGDKNDRLLEFWAAGSTEAAWVGVSPRTTAPANRTDESPDLSANLCDFAAIGVTGGLRSVFIEITVWEGVSQGIVDVHLS